MMPYYSLLDWRIFARASWGFAKVSRTRLPIPLSLSWNTWNVWQDPGSSGDYGVQNLRTLSMSTGLSTDMSYEVRLQLLFLQVNP